MNEMKSSLEAAGFSSIFRSEIKPMKKSQKESGFTLIEIILALGLTAMLLGLLSTSVFIVAEDWNRNSDVLDDSLDDALAILHPDPVKVPWPRALPGSNSRSEYFRI